MPKTRKKSQQLLVEGKDDRHVIWALCAQHKIPETFSVELPNDRGTEGIDALLFGLTARLKNPNLRTLGIVVDADRDLQSRWQAIRDRLASVGYENIPDVPPLEGWIQEETRFPKVGVWLMPNNELPGMLEDFVAYLIPATDMLRLKAESVLQELEQDGIQRYSIVHYPKALIHTWLAWQEKPGMPMGQAITAKALQAESSVVGLFVDWLKSLFE